MSRERTWALQVVRFNISIGIALCDNNHHHSNISAFPAWHPTPSVGVDVLGPFVEPATGLESLLIPSDLLECLVHPDFQY